MAMYYYFRSERRPGLHAFTDDGSALRLPREEGPWRLVRTVDPAEGWSGAVELDTMEAGVKLNGYFLVESDAELTFDETATRARDFR